MTLKKKMFGLGTAAVLALGLAACGNDDKSEIRQAEITLHLSVTPLIIKLRESTRAQALWKRLKEPLRIMNLMSGVLHLDQVQQ